MVINCTRCGFDFECTREEVGGRESYSGVYTHICAKCGHKEKSKVVREGQAGSYDDDEICPMCGKVHWQKTGP